MNKLLDKLILFTLCIVFYVQYAQGEYIIVPIICVLSASALASYFQAQLFRFLVFAAYCVCCFVFPVLLFFIPLFCYDVLGIKWKYAVFLAVLPAAARASGIPAASWVFIVLFAALSWFLNQRTGSLEKARREFISLRDSTKELSLRLEDKNRELLEKQDYEVNLATLNERNRIARDIHDSIGHILSNSILQTGALMATCREEAMRERLTTLKDTLSQGMDSIRESIHNLHDEAVDLYTEAKTLVDNFHFCEISMDYDVDGNPDKKIKYALLAVLKEALSNIIKHSNASFVQVVLREHPALYQLSVKDDGIGNGNGGGDGIGLINIRQRVGELNGVVNISGENGFTVFISIPKEK